jgi:hypothetical protein
MIKLKLQDLVDGKVPKGSLILVRWTDASDIRALLSEHEAEPEVVCKDWGLYLGISGKTKRMLILGKDVVEVHNEWGATRIPLELVDEVILILPREDMLKAIREIQILSRRVNLRKYQRKEERFRVTVDT